MFQAIDGEQVGPIVRFVWGSPGVSLGHWKTQSVSIASAPSGSQSSEPTRVSLVGCWPIFNTPSWGIQFSLLGIYLYGKLPGFKLKVRL